jgi:hypothetical protein
MFDVNDRKQGDARIGRCSFVFGMVFNIVRHPYWKEAIIMVNNTPKGYVPPVMRSSTLLF